MGLSDVANLYRSLAPADAELDVSGTELSEMKSKLEHAENLVNSSTNSKKDVENQISNAKQVTMFLLIFMC